MALDYLQIKCNWVQRNIQTLTISGLNFIKSKTLAEM